MVFLAGPRRQTSVGGECQQPALLPAPRPLGELIHRPRARNHDDRCASCNRLGCDRHRSWLCRLVPCIARPAGCRCCHRAAVDARSRCPRRSDLAVGTAYLAAGGRLGRIARRYRPRLEATRRPRWAVTVLKEMSWAAAGLLDRRADAAWCRCAPTARYDVPPTAVCLAICLLEIATGGGPEDLRPVLGCAPLHVCASLVYYGARVTGRSAARVQP